MKRTVKQPKHTGKITAEQARKAVRAARDGMTDINTIIARALCCPYSQCEADTRNAAETRRQESHVIPWSCRADLQPTAVKALIGAVSDAGYEIRKKGEGRPAYWTCDTSYGNLYYFAPREAAPAPYLKQRHVKATIDIAEDGTLAGVELIEDMPPPPISAWEEEQGE